MKVICIQMVVAGKKETNNLIVFCLDFCVFLLFLLINYVF